ncbi:unnamed protein product [Onchocerca ochengi]|uniref:DUF397 domain-containing protein n=1 Tax=Onchocerca ochengi TaxID=42157 RepID=A0A182EMS4_ONCOC|nr:unnamed protein product [Onchocerca ochengi]
MRAERHTASLADARLRVRRSCSAASDLLCSEQNERDRLRVAERQTKRICCADGKIKLLQLGESPEPLKTLLAGYTADSKYFLSAIRK